MREATDDFIEIVRRKRHCFKDGVVHSFTGTIEEAQQLLSLGLYIGINGWYKCV
jgi:TatD DNase family protein